MNMRLNQTGFVLPAAIFLLIVLAALGAYAVNLTSVQQITSTQDLEGSRAYHAARAGVESGIYQVLTPGNNTLNNCPATNPQILTIDAYTVNVSCTVYGQYYEQSADHSIKVYKITADASKGTINTPQYIARQVEVTISKCLGTDATPNYQCN